MAKKARSTPKAKRTGKATKKAQAKPAPGRDESGRFVRGNAGGPGNPHAGAVAKLRAIMLDEVSEQDMRRAVRALISVAHTGDVPALRELFDRLLGKAKQTVEHEGEVKTGGLDFEQMTDLELASIITAGGLELPPLLAAKVKAIQSGALKTPANN